MSWADQSQRLGWFLSAAADRYADCARALGLPADATALVDELERLNSALDVPRLTDLGVAREAWDAAIPVMTAQAIASGSPANNPTVPSAEEIAELYARVFR